MADRKRKGKEKMSETEGGGDSSRAQRSRTTGAYGGQHSNRYTGLSIGAGASLGAPRPSGPLSSQNQAHRHGDLHAQRQPQAPPVPQQPHGPAPVEAGVNQEDVARMIGTYGGQHSNLYTGASGPPRIGAGENVPRGSGPVYSQAHGHAHHQAQGASATSANLLPGGALGGMLQQQQHSLPRPHGPAPLETGVNQQQGVSSMMGAYGGQHSNLYMGASGPPRIRAGQNVPHWPGPVARQAHWHDHLQAQRQASASANFLPGGALEGMLQRQPQAPPGPQPPHGPAPVEAGVNQQQGVSSMMGAYGGQHSNLYTGASGPPRIGAGENVPRWSGPVSSQAAQGHALASTKFVPPTLPDRCSVCNKYVFNNDRHCRDCLQRQPQGPPVPQQPPAPVRRGVHPGDETYTFLEKIRKNMKEVCPNCNSNYLSDEKKCWKCGADLVEVRRRQHLQGGASGRLRTQDNAGVSRPSASVQPLPPPIMCESYIFSNDGIRENYPQLPLHEQSGQRMLAANPDQSWTMHVPDNTGSQLKAQSTQPFAPANQLPDAALGGVPGVALPHQHQQTQVVYLGPGPQLFGHEPSASDVQPADPGVQPLPQPIKVLCPGCRQDPALWNESDPSHYCLCASCLFLCRVCLVCGYHLLSGSS